MALTLATSIGAFAAGVHTGTKYSGRTGQHHVLSFKVSRKGAKVTAFKTRINYVCTGGVQATGSFTSRDMAIRGGKFGESTAAHGTGGGEAVRTARSSITAKFLANGTATGTIRERATLHSGLKCDSGKVTFIVTAAH